MAQYSTVKEQTAKEVIILAGGLGTRLQPVVRDLPKCLAPVNGKPFLHFVMAHLQKNGMEHFIFSLGYKSELIIDFIEKEYPDISKTYLVEKEQLGTGGAIKAACKTVKGKAVVIVNGDTLFTADINKLISFHYSHSADCTIAVKLLKNNSRYGTVDITSQGLVKSFTEKKQQAQGYINGGMYVLDVRHFLNEPLPLKFSFEKDWLQKNTRVKSFYGVKNNKYFIDIGIPEDYAKANAQLSNLKM
jgi:D-glycero-alpha-D-manno-heptose 1-phosphate guanylyltransferase